MKYILTLALTYGALAQAKPACEFQVDKNSLEVGWTAFKTTQKAPVNGAFTKHEIKGKLEAKSLKALLEQVSVTVDMSSVDTKNPDRDKTLREKFFALIKPAPVAGKFKKISEKEGKADLVLNFNGVEHTLPATFTRNPSTHEIEASATMDLPTFAADSALASLHTACEKLHMGADGVSKTWPEVKINLKAKFNKECE